jgi:5-methylcytosine-specific restriction endonuclease McrA
MSTHLFICAGCGERYRESETTFYRRKRWCGSVSCRNVIDTKVKNNNYRMQMKKIKKGKYRRGVDTETKAEILKRDSTECKICSFRDEQRLQIHHIVPVSNGGSDDYDNLITLCHKCHVLIHKEGCEKYEAYFKNYTASMEENEVFQRNGSD